MVASSESVDRLLGHSDLQGSPHPEPGITMQRRLSRRLVTNSVLPAMWGGLVPQVPLLTGACVVSSCWPLLCLGAARESSLAGIPGAAIAVGRVTRSCTGRAVAAKLQPFSRAVDALKRRPRFDHVYPWSRGGPTIISNGQALCRDHDRRKSNLRPPWWYVLAYERRRAGWFPPGVDVRVHGRTSADERAARLTLPGRDAASHSSGRVTHLHREGCPR